MHYAGRLSFAVLATYVNAMGGKFWFSVLMSWFVLVEVRGPRLPWPGAVLADATCLAFACSMAAGCGLLTGLILIVTFVVKGARVGATIWLSVWTGSVDVPGGAPHGPFWYLGIYTAISAVQVLKPSCRRLPDGPSGRSRDHNQNVIGRMHGCRDDTISHAQGTGRSLGAVGTGKRALHMHSAAPCPGRWAAQHVLLALQLILWKQGWDSAARGVV